MKTTASVEIEHSIETVFRYTNEEVPQWSLTVIEDRPTNDLRGLGATFLCVTEEHGRRMEFDGEVTLWDPPHRSAVELIGKQFDISAEYLFEDLSGRTRVTQHSSVRFKGFTKMLMLIVGPLIAKQGLDAVNRELQSLKAKLESQTH